MSIEPEQFSPLCNLREIVRTNADSRIKAARQLLERDTSRLDLRYIIEFVEPLRAEAWETLKGRNPTQFELIYIALNVSALRNEAWEMLVHNGGFVDELYSIANICPELRDHCWEIILVQGVQIHKLKRTPLPSDPLLIGKIWEKLQSMAALMEVCQAACMHPALLSQAIRVVVQEEVWDPWAILMTISAERTHWSHDGFQWQYDFQTESIDIANELRRHRPNAFFELLPVAIESCYKFVLLLHSGSDQRRIWDAVMSELDLRELEKVMLQIPTLRNEAWEQFKSLYDPNSINGFVPFDSELGSLLEEVWSFLIEVSPETLFGPRSWPDESLAYIRRDWYRIKSFLTFESLKTIWVQLKFENQEFSSSVVKELACKSPSFQEFRVTFYIDNIYSGVSPIAFSTSPCSVLNDLEKTHGTLNPSQLRQLHIVSSLDRPAIELRLLCLDCPLDDILELLHLDLSEISQTEVIKRVLGSTRLIPNWALVKIINHFGPEEQMAVSESLRFRLPAESTESLIQIACSCECFTEEAFEIACREKCDKRAIMKFVENAPRVRARAIAILRRTGALDNDDLVWLLKHFPSFMEDSHKNLQFICKDPWHRGRGELVFLDIDESDDRESKSIKWLFDVGGVQLHEFSCIGKRITLGFSTHKYFDPFWWYCGDKSQYHPDEKPIRRLDVDYPTEPYESDFPRRLERQINRSYLNPNVRAVQVVEFVEEARVAVEVEFLCGSVHRGWLTWCNSD